MKNGKTIASRKSKRTGATVAYVVNESGTVKQREVTATDGLGETRIYSVPDAVARVLVETNDDLVRAAAKKLGLEPDAS